MSIAQNGAAGPAEIRVLAVDCSHPLSRERLRPAAACPSAVPALLCSGTERLVFSHRERELLR
jgi:hypothetical protein